MNSSDINAVSGATPRSGTQSYTWDLTDKDGEAVLPGEYNIIIEGTLRWKNRVVYTAMVETGETPAVVFAEAEYIYEASDRQAAFTDESAENAMIGTVTVSFIP